MTYHSQKLVEAKQAWSNEIIATFGPDDLDAVFEPRGEGNPGTKLYDNMVDGTDTYKVSLLQKPLKAKA